MAKMTVEGLKNKLQQACDQGGGGKDVVILASDGEPSFISDGQLRGEPGGDNFALQSLSKDELEEEGRDAEGKVPTPGTDDSRSTEGQRGRGETRGTVQHEKHKPKE